MASTSDPARELLRHSLATVAYRGGKALRGSPDHFGSFHIGDKTRTPGANPRAHGRFVRLGANHRPRPAGLA